MTIRSSLRMAALGAAIVCASAGSALAHPHVWVTSTSELVFGSDGSIVAVRHAWTFDEMFSAFATQGLDKDNDGKLSREELAELAEVNVTSLKEFNFFSVGKVDGNAIAFGNPVDYWLEANAEKVLTLRFTLPVKAKKAKSITLDVFDPTWFVDFTYAEKDPIKLVNAPAGCAADVKKPETPGTAQSTLSESFFNSLTAASQFGSQFANRITVSCK